MWREIMATAVLFFIVLDPLGNIPLFLSVLNPVAPERWRRIILRESLIGLGVLLLFLFQGQRLLSLLHVSVSSLSLAGGIILFLIALSMIFKGAEDLFKAEASAEPFIVPLAIPLIAGPSAITTVTLWSARTEIAFLGVLVALMIAWLLSTVVLMTSRMIYRALGMRVIMAVERLMGLMLAVISVEMLVNGLRQIAVLPPAP